MLDVSLGDLSGKDPDWRRNDVKEQHPDTYQWADSLMRARVMRDTMMTTHDGRRLHAWYAAAENSTDTTAILLHGYTCNAWTVMNIARMMRERLGLNIFLPEMHGHGKSDGNEVQMGWKDANDVLEWMPLVTHLFGDSAQSRIVIHGVSMGASTAMNISGMEHSPQIVGFIEDCGYTTPKDIIMKTARDMGLPAKFLYPFARIGAWLFGGFDVEAASPIESVANMKIPLLIIHGYQDGFVPYSMGSMLYDACTGPKRMETFDRGEHAVSALSDPWKYESVVTSFIKGLQEEEA